MCEKAGMTSLKGSSTFRSATKIPDASAPRLKQSRLKLHQQRVFDDGVAGGDVEGFDDAVDVGA